MSGYLYFYAKHPAIEKIADRLNSAGNAYHHTEYWSEVEDYNNGKSWSDLIQDALAEASSELAAAQKDAERYRLCQRYGFPVRNQTPTQAGVTWTIDGKWFGQTPTECIDAAIVAKEKA